MTRLSLEHRKAVLLFVFLAGAPIGLFVRSGGLFHEPLEGDRHDRGRSASPLSGSGDFSREGKGSKEQKMAARRGQIPLSGRADGQYLEAERPSKNQGDSNPPELENQYVAELRALGFQRPQEMLSVAREAREVFPEGATIAERTWYEARALVELGEFGEAQALARWLVEHHPMSSFSRDLERHLLSSPLGLPPRRHSR